MSRELMLALGIGEVFLLGMLIKREFYENKPWLGERVAVLEAKVSILIKEREDRINNR